MEDKELYKGMSEESLKEIAALQEAQDKVNVAISPLFECAITMYHVFNDLITAGFTEDQALKMISYMIKVNAE